MTLVRNIPGSGPQPVSVRALASPAVEAVVAFWTQQVELEDAETYAEHEVLQRIWSKTEEVADDVAWMGRNYAAAWTGLLPAIDESGAGDLAELADYLEALPPGEVRALVAEGWHEHTDECSKCDPTDAVELEPAAEVDDRVVGALRSIHALVGEEFEAFSPKQKHTTEIIRFLKRRMALDRLVETVTNGVVYKSEAGVREVVLVPSGLLRPWNLLFLFGSDRYIVHPISEESIDADADKPPSWMNDLFKALGDERRLRLLRHLNDVGSASLGDLANYLDHAKSTTHHHLRTLRAAGLVRARLQSDHKDESRYELREELLPDLVSLVSEYLLSPPEPTA